MGLKYFTATPDIALSVSVGSIAKIKDTTSGFQTMVCMPPVVLEIAIRI